MSAKNSCLQNQKKLQYRISDMAYWSEREVLGPLVLSEDNVSDLVPTSCSISFLGPFNLTNSRHSLMLMRPLTSSASAPRSSLPNHTKGSTEKNDDDTNRSTGGRSGIARGHPRTGSEQCRPRELSWIRAIQL